jgi:transposase
MRHIQGENRHQTHLLPPSLEDFVAADHPVRVIDALVNKLDLATLGFSKAVTKDTGRKPYDPADLLKLYVYGYINQVNTSRRLERECQRNLEVMWLLGRLAPDFKTIADFRKDNGAAIRQCCRAFIQFCRQAGLLSGRLVAIDGSKFKAAASKDQALNRKQLNRDRALIEQQVASYLARLDRADREDTELGLAQERVQAALKRLDRLDRYEQAMDAGDRNQHCDTEPDARIMRSGRDGMVLGYNVQTAVDADSGLIVHHEVSQDTGDNRLLQPMAEQAKAALQLDHLAVVADAGYSNGQQQADLEAQGIAVAAPRRVIPGTDKALYQKADFDYDRERNEYRCPAGQVLHHCADDKRRKLHIYQRAGCRQCALQPKCAKSDIRSITRNFNEDAFERSEARLKADPALMTRRMAIVERPFAVLKQAMGLRRFVCRGMAAVETEMAIAVTGYNLKQMIHRVGVPRMLALLA